MPNKPLVSIIIPIYNSEKFLNNTVESVLNQTYENFELILINDGSTDTSAQICDAFAKIDHRIQVHHISNNGPGNARNLGISLAKGNYIQFVDSDDSIEFNMVEQLVKYMISEMVEVVVCGMKNLDPPNQATISSYPAKLSLDNEIKNDFVHLLKLGLAYSPVNKMYRKSIIDEYNIKFNDDLLIGEDALFNIKYFSKCSKVFIYDKPLYIYHQRVGSLTKRIFHEKEMAQMLLYQKMTEFLGNELASDTVRELNAYYLMEFSFIIYQNSIGIKSIGDFFNKVKDTKKFIKRPEFKAVAKSSYYYSSLQRLILFFLKMKCETLLMLFLYCHNRFYKKPLPI
ncbi:glycosyltransferase family 2 protein [Gottfriedia acidiceleris]|uniref:glycosyltransferase family 2 protein n=1 Tax=Gottfriedia acidiceleris TaxID=371036 RepID=UPI000B43D6DC|nr:glycosyltransferase family 2 protein [Gottfriedia acidiceleris]